jgi:hypothetical protein
LLLLPLLGKIQEEVVEQAGPIVEINLHLVASFGVEDSEMVADLAMAEDSLVETLVVDLAEEAELVVAGNLYFCAT